MGYGTIVLWPVGLLFSFITSYSYSRVSCVKLSYATLLLQNIMMFKIFILPNSVGLCQLLSQEIK